MAENTTAQAPQTAAMMPSTSPQTEKPFIPKAPFPKKRIVSVIIAHFPPDEKARPGNFFRFCKDGFIVGKIADKNKIFMKNS